MEFIHHDGNNLNKFFIDRKCLFIKINDDVETVTKIYVFTETIGKISTEYSIIKYSKNTLYHYDSNNNIRGIYKFSRFVKETPNIMSIKESNDTFSIREASTQDSVQDSTMLHSEFIVKKDVNVKLLKNIDTENYFIEYLENVQPVVSVHSLGKYYTVYTTKDYELQISSNISRNNKFNGIPISQRQ
jgi:hypothetical protein